MSYKVTIEGTESFEVAKECVRKVTFTTDIPLDANAWTKGVGSTLTILPFRRKSLTVTGK